MYVTMLDGVIFIEGDYPLSRPVRPVTARLDGVFAQLKSLDDVKRALAAQVKSAGGNCLTNFVYGQKSSFWSWDHVKWEGSGTAAVLQPAEIAQLLGAHR